MQTHVTRRLAPLFYLFTRFIALSLPSDLLQMTIMYYFIIGLFHTLSWNITKPQIISWEWRKKIKRRFVRYSINNSPSSRSNLFSCSSGDNVVVVTFWTAVLFSGKLAIMLAVYAKTKRVSLRKLMLKYFSRWRDLKNRESIFLTSIGTLSLSL